MYRGEEAEVSKELIFCVIIRLMGDYIGRK